MPITNAQLAQKISDLIDSQRARDLEYQAWLAGAADGGPYGDGRFPLTDYLGTTRYTYSPAALETSVGVSAGASADSADESAASVVAALAAQAAAETASGLSLTYRDAAQSARDLTLLYRDEAAGHTATALVYRNKARDWSSKAVDSVVESGLYSALHYATKASESGTAADTSETNAANSASAASTSATNAATSAADAAASALAAQTWNPANYAALAGATFTGLVKMEHAQDEKLRMVGGSAYLSFYSDAATRRGYIQSSASALHIVMDQNLPMKFWTNTVLRQTIEADGRTTFAQPLYIETTGNAATYRNIEIKSAGQPNLAFGSYSGVWRPSLTIQGDTNASYLFMVAPSSAGVAGRIQSSPGASLEMYVGSTLMATFETGTGYFVPSSWVRLTQGTGLYTSSAYYWYPSAGYWESRSGNGIIVRDTSAVTRGYVYFDGSGFGLLHGGGGWMLRGDASHTLIANNAGQYAYGGWYCSGVHGGYSGIAFPDITGNPTLMMNATTTGIYKQSTSQWSFYDDWSSGFNVYRPIKDGNTGGAYLRHDNGTYNTGNITVSTAAASGTPAGNGALWIQYT